MWCKYVRAVATSLAIFLLVCCGTFERARSDVVCYECFYPRERQCKNLAEPDRAKIGTCSSKDYCYKAWTRDRNGFPIGLARGCIGAAADRNASPDASCRTTSNYARETICWACDSDKCNRSSRRAHAGWHLSVWTFISKLIV